LQSQELESYESLTKKSESFDKEYSNSTIERPARWGGFIVSPTSIEFWIDQKNRLHKRELYSKSGPDWNKALLSP
jgi:pyridoxamine 5'-phosphate oxidase